MLEQVEWQFRLLHHGQNHDKSALHLVLHCGDDGIRGHERFMKNCRFRNRRKNFDGHASDPNYSIGKRCVCLGGGVWAPLLRSGAWALPLGVGLGCCVRQAA
eukprot:4532647-Pleurochrysis_carterae.AAC.1